MSARRLLLAAAVAAFGLTLAGCVDGGPYYGAYTYSDYDGSYYDPGYYGPGYYSGGVVYGGYYTSRHGHYARRHHHSGSYDRRPRYRHSSNWSNTRDHDRGRTWQHRGARSSHRAAIRSGNSQVNRMSYKSREYRSRDRRRLNDERN
jgi:hypothetical protein